MRILFLLLLFIVGLLLTPQVGDVVAVMLLIIGFKFLLEDRHAFFKVIKQEFLVFAPFIFFSLLSVVFYLSWPTSDGARMKLERYATFMFAVSLYFVFIRVNVPPQLVNRVFQASLIIVSMVAVSQYVSMYAFNTYIFTFGNWVAEYWLRPSGAVHPMRFSALTFILLCFVLVWQLINRDKISSLTLLAVVLGCLAVIFSKTRGTWLAVLIIFFVYLSWLVINHFSAKKRFIVGLTSIFLVFALGQSAPVKDRVLIAFDDVERYLSGDHQSSVGARLDMFYAAYLLIKERPVSGHGLDSYKDKALVIKSKHPSMSGDVGRWRNPHNEILQVWVEKGVLGLLSYILILGGPLLLFLGGIRHSVEGARYYAWCGVLTIGTYFIVGQSVALFEHRVFNLFYCVIVMFLLAQFRLSEGKGIKAG